jgi:hypothetical protein
VLGGIWLSNYYKNTVFEEGVALLAVLLGELGVDVGFLVALFLDLLDFQQLIFNFLVVVLDQTVFVGVDRCFKLVQMYQNRRFSG